MRTFNVRLAAILLAALVVFGGSVFGVHYYQVGTFAEFFRIKAEEAKKQVEQARKDKDKKAETKALEKEIKNLMSYISKLPSDAPDFDAENGRAGLLLVECEQYGLALNYLIKAVDHDPVKFEEAGKKLVDIYLLMGRPMDAKTFIEKVLKKKPDDPSMLTYLGRCERELKHNSESKAAFYKAIKFSPKAIDAYAQLAILLQLNPELKQNRVAQSERKEGDEEVPVDPEDAAAKKPEEEVDEADATMDAMIANNPDSAKAHFSMSRYYLVERRQAPDMPKALEHAEKAVELAPEEIDNLIWAAECNLRSGKFDAVRNHVANAFKLEKDDPRVKFGLFLYLAHAEYGDKNIEKAMEVLSKGYLETKHPDLLWQKATWLLDSGKIDPAKECIQELSSRNFDRRQLDYLRGRINLMHSQWREACADFESARPGFVNRRELFLLDYSLGVCYGKLQNREKQIAALQLAVKERPDFAPASELLAEAYRLTGKLDDAWNTLSTVKSSDAKNPGLEVSRVNLLIAQVKQLPKDQRRWEDVEKMLDEMEKRFPDAIQVPLLRCEVMVSQERFEEAEKSMMNLIRKDTKNPMLWNNLINMLSRQKKWDKVDDIFTRYEKFAGDSVELRASKAIYYYHRFGKEAAPKLVVLEENIDAFDEKQKGTLLGVLLDIAMQCGDEEQISRLSKQFVEKDPNNILLQSKLLDRAYYASDLSAMEKILDEIQRIEGEGPVWLRGQASLRSRKFAAGGNPALLDEALKLLERAADKRSSWAAIPLMVGQIYDQKNDFPRALESYLESINLGDYRPLAIRRSVGILVQLQRYAEAIELLDRMEREQVSLSPEVIKVWADILMHRGAYEQALAKARLAVPDKSNDFKDYLWLGGQILHVVANKAKEDNRKREYAELLAEEEKALRRAVELGPDEPSTWIVLIQFLVGADKFSEAEKAFEEARPKIVGKKDATLQVAKCLQLLKKIEQAKEQYTAALAAEPNNSTVVCQVAEFFLSVADITQAEALLNRIIEEKEFKSNDIELMWARRSMVRILKTRTGFENIERSRQLIEKNLAIDPKSLIDNRTKAELDSRDPRVSARDDRKKTIEDMVKIPQASQEDRYQLFLIYKANDDWKNASEIIRKLAVESTEEPKYLGEYIQELLAHGEVSDAKVYLQKMQDKWPNHVGTIRLQAELLVREKQSEEALDLMKGFIDRPNAIPADRSQRIRILANWMEDLAHRVAKNDEGSVADSFLRTAEVLQRQYVDDHPSAALELVAFLARQKRLDDALDFLERNYRYADTINLAQICMEVSLAGKAPQPIIDRVMQILEEARKGDPQKNLPADHPAILLTIGTIFAGGDKFEEAEALYRQVLNKNEGHVIAMNNLAVLLAATRQKLPEALDWINKAIKITGPLAAMLDTRACVYIAQGNAEKALADINAAVKDIKQPDTLFHQSQALELAGQKNAAALAMREALNLGLIESKLLKPEHPTFERLKKLADELSPVRKK